MDSQELEPGKEVSSTYEVEKGVPLYKTLKNSKY